MHCLTKAHGTNHVTRENQSTYTTILMKAKIRNLSTEVACARVLFSPLFALMANGFRIKIDSRLRFVALLLMISHK